MSEYLQNPEDLESDDESCLNCPRLHDLRTELERYREEHEAAIKFVNDLIEGDNNVTHITEGHIRLLSDLSGVPDEVQDRISSFHQSACDEIDIAREKVDQLRAKILSILLTCTGALVLSGTGFDDNSVTVTVCNSPLAYPIRKGSMYASAHIDLDKSEEII